MGTFIMVTRWHHQTLKSALWGPHMNAMGRYLAQSLTITTQLRSPQSPIMITNFTSRQRMAVYTASRVLVTVPVDQMISLLPSYDVRDIASRFTMEPTWTVVSDLETTLRDRHDDPLDALFGGDHNVLISSLQKK